MMLERLIDEIDIDDFHWAHGLPEWFCEEVMAVRGPEIEVDPSPDES